MRGKASAKIYEQAKTRITPAYAGKSAAITGKYHAL